MVDGTNMLGLIVFSLVLGITLGQIGKVGRPLLKVFSSLSSAMLEVTRKLIWYYLLKFTSSIILVFLQSSFHFNMAGPVSVIFLISGSLVTQDDINDVFSNLSWYIWVMVVTYLVHGFVILPILYFVLTRRLPFQFIKDIAPAIFSAFGTASRFCAAIYQF
jgi:Na+/H+-dicarboxylate symporter